MALKNTIQAIPMTTIDSATLTDVYQPINIGGLPNSCFQLRMVNASDVEVTVSYDGVTDNEILLATSINVIPSIHATSPNNFPVAFPKGMVVYVKGTAGTGDIFISGYYQPSSTV